MMTKLTSTDDDDINLITYANYTFSFIQRAYCYKSDNVLTNVFNFQTFLVLSLTPLLTDTSKADMEFLADHTILLARDDRRYQQIKLFISQEAMLLIDFEMILEAKVHLQRLDWRVSVFISFQ